MPEANGSGRLDRIEAILEAVGDRMDRLGLRVEQIAELHDQDFKKLMTWQVLMQDKMDRWAKEAAEERKRLDTLFATTDKRIADLVAAIGRLIESK